jgi:hypothetical protein
MTSPVTMWQVIIDRHRTGTFLRRQSCGITIWPSSVMFQNGL